MKILSNSNGTFLLDGENAMYAAMAFYEENGYEFDNNGTGCLCCGDDCLYENVEEIGYDAETETQTIKIEYLVHESGARYSKTEMIGDFVDGEMIGTWTLERDES